MSTARDDVDARIRAVMDRVRVAVERIGEALTNMSFVMRQRVRPAFRRAAAEMIEEAAVYGDPFARRVLAHAGHPRWAPEMQARALRR